MRIRSINNALTGFVRTARRTVAAGMIAASPMAVKAEAAAEQIIPRECSKTNLVEMSSWLSEFGNYVKYQGVVTNVSHFAMKTNDMPRVANANLISVTKDTIKLGGVADGDVLSAQLLVSDDVRKPLDQWRKFDFFARTAHTKYEEGTATAWVGSFYREHLPNSDKQHFFKWIVNPKLDAKKGDFGTQIKFTDEKGNIIPNFEY